MGVYINADLIYGLDLHPDHFWDNDSQPEGPDFLRDFLINRGFVPHRGGALRPDEELKMDEAMELLLDYLTQTLNLRVEFYGENEFCYPIVGVANRSLGDHWQPIEWDPDDITEIDSEDHEALKKLQADLKLQDSPKWYICISRG